MDDQTFRYIPNDEGYLTIEQTGGAKLVKNEANAMLRDIAAIRGIPIGKIRLRIDYSLLPDPVVTGFVPQDEADAAAIQDIANAAARYLERTSSAG